MTIHDLETEALNLPPTERVRLAHMLMSSIDQLSPEDLGKLWLEEAERRDEEMESGAAQGIPGDEVLQRIRARHS